MVTRFFLLAGLLALLSFVSPALSQAEDVPLENCDGLPVMQITADGAKLRFLVDTGATSMLNTKSFAHGDSRKVSVTSWSGTVETKSREVTVHELLVGQHQVKDLHLPAIDLSAIGAACGKRIDGILGVDLLSRLGMTVDLKNHTAQMLPDTKTADALVAELHAQLTSCEDAFNRGDEAVFAECLDPEIVTFTVAGDFYGRDTAMSYYRKKYFQQDPRGHLFMVQRAHHLIGDAIWVEYDLKVVLRQQIVLARGSALCRKSNGRWRIVHMIHSSPPAPELQAQSDEESRQK